MLALALHLSALLAELLITAVWTAGSLALCVMLALRALPELPARLRSASWMVTFAVALILPVAMVFRPGMHSTTTTSHVHAGIAWALPLAAAWIILSAYRVGGLFLGAWHLRKSVGRTVEAFLPPGVMTWFAAQRFIRRVQVRVSQEVDRPSVAGYLRPAILLPADMLSSTDDADLQRILLHEAEHIRRFDDCVNLLQKFAVALFPFSPALLWMERRLCLERELACDDAVLASTGAPRAYAICLAQMAEKSLQRRISLLAVAAFGRQPELSRRVHRILQWAPPQASRWVFGAASAALLCALGAGTAGLQRFGVPVAFGASPVEPVLRAGSEAATLSSHAAVFHGGVSTTLTDISYHLPGSGAKVDAQARPVQTVALSHDLNSRLTVRHRAAGANTIRPNGPAVRQSVEQRIEYVPAPMERRPLSAFEQVSYPYAIIPAGNVWLVIQL